MSEKRKLSDFSDVLSPSSSSSPLLPTDLHSSNSLQPSNHKKLRLDDFSLIPSPSPPSTSSSPPPPLLPPRTSSLSSPTLRLTGHSAAVLCCQFSPSGGHLITAGLDCRLLLWDMTSPRCTNSLVMTGHKGGILNVGWMGGGEPIVVSGSVDGTVGVWDCETGLRIKRLTNHSGGGVVNAVGTSTDPQSFITGGDDGRLLLFDRRGMKRPIGGWTTPYQILTVALSSSLQQTFHSGIDSRIHCIDLRTLSSSHSSPPTPLYSLSYHTEAVTGLALNGDSSLLLSHSSDSTLHCYSVQPYVPPSSSRLLQRYVGSVHDLDRNLLRCGWSPDSAYVTGGSGGRGEVLIWETGSGVCKWRLPGHKGCVNEVAFHPTEPIIASAGNDKTVLIGEL